jgi:hypothetical protein
VSSHTDFDRRVNAVRERMRRMPDWGKPCPECKGKWSARENRPWHLDGCSRNVVTRRAVSPAALGATKGEASTASSAPDSPSGNAAAGDSGAGKASPAGDYPEAEQLRDEAALRHLGAPVLVAIARCGHPGSMFDVCEGCFSAWEQGQEYLPEEVA